MCEWETVVLSETVQRYHIQGWVFGLVTTGVEKEVLICLFLC